MKIWKVTLEVQDDGIEDETKEIKGDYFTKKELIDLFPKSMNTAGLTIKNVKLELKK